MKHSATGVYVKLPCGMRLYITDIEVWSDYSVGIPEHIDNYKAVITDSNCEVNYDALSDQENTIIDNAIWDALEAQGR